MRESFLLALVFAALPGTAFAGWTAKQTSRSVGATVPPQTSELFFEKGLFRVDPDPSSSVVIDLAAGKFTFINHKDKKHATITVEELIAMRDQTLAQMKAQLPNLPPEVRKQIEAQIAEAEGDAKPESVPKPTGKTLKVNGYDCSVYTWKQADSENEACIAPKLSIDVKEFAAATTKLSDRLSKATGGKGGTGMFAMLELGKHGFPVQTKRTIKQGETTVEAISEISEVKSAKLEAAKFEVPKGYEKGDLQSVMQSSQRPGGP